MKIARVLLALAFFASGTAMALAATASEGDYQRGYGDCLAGRYDQEQHGESYKQGCSAAEDKLKSNGATLAQSNTTAPATATPTPGQTATSSDVPKPDRKACKASVKEKTKNDTIKVLSWEFSQANNTVIVGVGPNKAKWKCLVKDGKVVDVTSLANE